MNLESKTKTFRELHETTNKIMTLKEELDLLEALELIDEYTNLSVFQKNLKGVLIRKHCSLKIR